MNCLVSRTKPCGNEGLKSSESEAANRPRCNSPVIKPVARKTIRPSVFILVIFSCANNNNVKIKLFPLPVGRTAKTFLPRSKSAICCSRLKISSRFDFREAFSFTTAKRTHHETYVIHIKAYSLLSDSGPDSQPIINSRPLVDGEFDYTAKPSRRSFPGLPDLRDRLPCRQVR